VIHGNAFDVHTILMCVESAADAVIPGDVAILKRLLLEDPGCAISGGLVGAGRTVALAACALSVVI
jgi:hypothetical protein